LCCHFCVVGSDVLPPFPSSLLFLKDPTIPMSCYVRFQESLLQTSDQQIAVQTGDYQR
jgi:hypothetical protein